MESKTKKVYVVTTSHNGCGGANTFSSYYSAQQFVKYLLDEGEKGIGIHTERRAAEISCG